MAQSSRRLRYLHHLLKRQILMILGRECPLAYLSNEIGNARVVTKINPQCQCVDEEANQRLDVTMAPVGTWRADHNIFLP
ncbi:hypothetical protein D3C84_1084310 [compost metagenome]